MARRKPGSGRVTSGKGSAERPIDASLPSIRTRRPIVFWFVIVAVAAMVLTTFASFFQAIS